MPHKYVSLVCDRDSLQCAVTIQRPFQRGPTLANDNPNLNQSTVERLTSSLKNMQEANSAKQEPVRYSSIEDQLAQAKASRTQAESARQKIANEILEATKGVCQKLIADGEQTLQKAKKLEAEAQRKHQEARAELEKAQAARAEAQAFAERVKSEAQKKAQERLDQAKAIRAEADVYRDKVMVEVQQQSQEQLDHAQNVRHEADTYRERVITEAKEQGQEILYLARSSAEKECNEIKRQAALEAQRTIAEAELIKAAAQEELEAQRIYAEAARLETESLEVLAQVRAKLGEPDSPPAEPKNHWESAEPQADGLWESEEESESEFSSSEDSSPSQVEQEHTPEEEVESVARSPRSRKSRASSQKE